MPRHFAVPADVPAAPRFEDVMRLPPGPARQERIARMIARLAARLAALHEMGEVHGGLSPAAVDLDASGEAMLTAPPAAPGPDAEDARRCAGYAAFEQYTDDPAYPCGPWTDVYGLSALACFLATGSAPPDALARRVRDGWQPLREWSAGAYGKAFCDAVDRGLAMSASARPQTMAAFAAAMGMTLPPPVASAAATPVEAGDDRDVPMAAVVGNTEVPAAPARGIAGQGTGMPPRQPASRDRRALPLAFVLMLLLAGGTYAWFRGMAPPDQVAGAPEPRSTSTASAPAPAQPEPDPAPASVQPPSLVQAPAAASPVPQASVTEANAPPELPKAAPVAVRVAVRPWGEVLINGRSRGVSPPLRELSLAPGRYQVTVRNASAGEHRMTLIVAPNRAAAIAHDFE